jgi:hypothetical protein
MHMLTASNGSSRSTRTFLAGSFAAMVCVTLLGTSAMGQTNNIMITGYWPPTNEMLRPFSQNVSQNPGGWQGGNWEGRGYNIHSYFPEFPGGVGVNPRGTGDFQVDYQAASADFWRVVTELRPVAIITFSRGSPGNNWELESRARKLPLNQWAPDYLAPTRPTPDLPIAQEPDNTIRQSSLPMTNIRNAVNAAGLGTTSFIDTSNAFGGTFVSEFTSYHSAWYAELNSAPTNPFRCVAGGHIHVGIDTPVASATTATQITLRELITHVNTIVPAPSTATIAIGALGVAGLRRKR